jgi:hypothetical protein
VFGNRDDDQNCTIGESVGVIHVASHVKEPPPDLLLASLSERYDASLSIFNIMSDA